MKQKIKRHLHVLVTAGPTVEPIDPVRFISNRSSGKMGFAMARACLLKKFKVTLVAGPTRLSVPKGCRYFPVQTAQEMLCAVLREFPQTDVVFMVAAVADYRVTKVSQQKIKKIANQIQLTLVKNPDILKILGERKKKPQILIGFAAETQKGVCFAQKKLKEKNLDWIVLNDVSKKGIGFDSDDNAVTLLSRDGRQIEIPKADKNQVAQKILQHVCS